MRKKALVIGRDHNLSWTLPQFLHRAGFSCDLITSSKLMKKSRFVDRYHYVKPNEPLSGLLSAKIKEGYDWIIPTEDQVLTEIANSSLSIDEKLALLPILRKENMNHLHSKIGLSQVFSAHGIKTPPFIAANGFREVIEGIEKLGYPVLLKVDASSGGGGVYECGKRDDFLKLKPDLFQKPLLVQKKIKGIEIDLSSLFFEGKLIHFSYAKVLKTSHLFGPSILRSYVPLAHVEEEIFETLQQVGTALGAHGFVNIGSIMTQEGLYFFEADMRPNVWVEISRIWGEDPAESIRNQRVTRSKTTLPSGIIVPYFLRMGGLEVLVNRYKVWSFIPSDDLFFVVSIMFNKWFVSRLRNYFSGMFNFCFR